MKRGHKIYPFSWFFVLSLSLLLGQQSSSYLTQKLMVESDLRSRIASALSKIIDDQKYVLMWMLILKLQVKKKNKLL